MNYALIENGVVVNIIFLNAKNDSEFPGAIKLDSRPVAIGDIFADGKFYRDGKEVLTEVEKLRAELQDMQDALNLLGVNANG